MPGSHLHKWAERSERLSHHLRPSTNTLEDESYVPDFMLRKHGFLSPSAPVPQQGALPHCYLPRDLAATYAERKPRIRMVAFWAWLGFQIVVIGSTLLTCSQVATTVLLTRHTLDIVLWTAPVVPVIGAPLALLALLKTDCEFRGACLLASIFCLLAAGVRTYPLMRDDDPDSRVTEACMLASGALNAAASAIWGGGCILLCYSRCEPDERPMAVGAISASAMIGLALSEAVMPSVVHGRSVLSQILVGEAVVTVVSLVGIYFGFPPPARTYERSSSTYSDALSGLVELKHCPKTRSVVLATGATALLLCWLSAVTASPVRESYKADDWAGDTQLLSCTKYFAYCAASIALGVFSVFKPHTRAHIGTLRTAAAVITLHAVSASWMFLVLSSTISLPHSASLVPAMIVSGAAEGSLVLVLLELISSTVPPLAVGVLGCVLYVVLNVSFAICLASVKYLSSDATSITAAACSVGLCVGSWVMVCVESWMNASQEGSMQHPLNTHWSDRNATFDRDDPLRSSPETAENPRHNVFSVY